LAVYIGMHIVS